MGGSLARKPPKIPYPPPRRQQKKKRKEGRKERKKEAQKEQKKNREREREGLGELSSAVPKKEIKRTKAINKRE